MEHANGEPAVPINQIQLVAADHSSIARIQVYSGRADITRIFRLSVRTGQNLATIDGLPTMLDQETLKVEGRGYVSIDSVIISRMECSKPVAGTRNETLNIRAAVRLSAEASGEIEIAVFYGVYGATWHPEYDIRVDNQTAEGQITLTYKASISQSTGEHWHNVPLTLKPATLTSDESALCLDTRASPSALHVSPLTLAPREGKGEGTASPSDDSGYSTTDDRSDTLHTPIDHRSTPASGAHSDGIFALEVPSLTSIACDGIAQSVTIAELRLNAKMAWTCTPKRDTKTYLTATIKNLSQYTLLRGIGDVYVDGSYVSHHEVPGVAPDESFICPLGFDQSIQVTYHPTQKKQSTSGFLKKHTTSVVTQNMTILNTKSVEVNDLTILDEITVPEDPRVKVHLVNPPLNRPVASKANSAAIFENADASVLVSHGVSATWDVPQGGYMSSDRSIQERKLRWNCSIPPGNKVDLVLQWEIVAPLDVLGLMLAVCYP